MTAQISDTVMFDGTEYRLLGIRGDNLFDSTTLGLKPTMFSTSCYRGFYCSYSVNKNKLLLIELTLMSSDKNLRVNGIKPKILMGEAIYNCIMLPIQFSGIIRLGADFIEEKYIHMGFQKATDFRKVIDLKFDDGTLIMIKDRSCEAEELRNQPPPIPEDVTDWIEDRFSLELEWE